MTKIEILESIKHDGQQFIQGEIRIVDDKLAGYFCGNGWSKDLSGQATTGARDTSEKTLDVHDSHIGHAAPTLGVDNHG